MIRLNLNMTEKTKIRLANSEDLSVLEEIRQKAFVPVFNSFRKILGDEIYTIAQEPEDNRHSELLSSMFFANSPWKIYAVELSGKIVGFISIQLNTETRVGEIGLNAVILEHSGKGIGTKMYKFA